MTVSVSGQLTIADTAPTTYTKPMHTADLTAHDRDIVIRSASHALADSVTPPGLRFRDGVTDFDVARLMMSLEMGDVIVRDGRGWKALDVRPVLMPFIPRLYVTIREAVGLGLAHVGTVQTAPSIVRTQLLAAPVHLRAGVGMTACEASAQVPYARYRLVDEEDLVDCSACLLAHR